MASYDNALKGILVLSLLVQGVNIAAGVLLYQYFDLVGATSTNEGYYIYILVASPLSCVLYFILIPLSLSGKNIVTPAFRIFLLLVIVLQFGIATVLSAMLRNQQQGFNNAMALLDNF